MVETLAVEWGPYGIQVNGLVPGLFPHEDMTADIQANLARTSDKDRTQPAFRVGRPRELGWAATFLASPYGRFISGHTLVVDGANWQRRSLTNPRWSPCATRWAGPLHPLRVRWRHHVPRATGTRVRPSEESDRCREEPWSEKRERQYDHIKASPQGPVRRPPRALWRGASRDGQRGRSKMTRPSRAPCR